MLNSDKQHPVGDSVTNTTTTTEEAAAAVLPIVSSAVAAATTATAGQSQAPDEGEILAAGSSTAPRASGSPQSDQFQSETLGSAALPVTASLNSVTWGDARREVRLGAVDHPPARPVPATPSSVARQPMRPRPTNPFRARSVNQTPEHEKGDWETIFGDANTGSTRQNCDDRMGRPFNDRDLDDHDTSQTARPPHPPLSPLFPGVPAERQLPLFGTGGLGGSGLPNRRLIFGEEGRPVFRPEQRLHRVNGYLFGEEEESANTTTTTTVTTTTRTTTTVTPSHSVRSRQGRVLGQFYEGDDEFSTEFEDIPLGTGNDTTTSERHLRVELTQPAPRPSQPEVARPRPHHLDQRETQPSQRESRSWFGRAVNYVATQANRITEGPDARMEARVRSGALPQAALDYHWAEKGKRPWRLSGRNLAGPRDAMFSTLGDPEREELGIAGRTHANVAHRPRGLFGEDLTRDDRTSGRGGRTGTREDCTDGRGGRIERHGGRPGGRDNQQSAHGRADKRPRRSGNIFESISDTQPMPEEDVRACQLAFDMTPDEFSRARRRAQEARQQSVARRAQVSERAGESSLEFDSSHVTESFEQDDSRDNEQGASVAQRAHRNWTEHDESSFGLSGNTSGARLSELDGYFADADVSNILPVVEPPRHPSPLSPDADLHRLHALQCLDQVFAAPATTYRQAHHHPAKPRRQPTRHPNTNNPYQMNMAFRLPQNPHTTPPLRSLWDNPRPALTPSDSLPSSTSATLLRAPHRQRIGLGRRDPPPSPSVSRTATRDLDILPSDSASNLAPAPGAMRRVRVLSQRNITPLLLARRASHAVGMSFRGPRGERGFELGELGGRFYELGDEVEAQGQQRGERGGNHWWARVVLV